MWAMQQDVESRRPRRGKSVGVQVNLSIRAGFCIPLLLYLTVVMKLIFKKSWKTQQSSRNNETLWQPGLACSSAVKQFTTDQHRSRVDMFIPKSPKCTPQIYVWTFFSFWLLKFFPICGIRSKPDKDISNLNRNHLVSLWVKIYTL